MAQIIKWTWFIPITMIGAFLVANEPPGYRSELWCAGANITLLMAGRQGGGAEDVMFDGAATAAGDLGATIDTTLWGDWNVTKMVDQLVMSIAQSPDGIIVSGYPGDGALGPAIDAARSAGIRVTSIDYPLPLAEARYKDNGFGWVGLDSYQAGYDLAREAFVRSKIKPADKVLVWGQLDSVGLQDRTRGILDSLTALGVTPVYKNIDVAAKQDPTSAVQPLADVIKANPGVKLVITDHGGVSSIHKAMLQAATVSNTSIYVAGVDLRKSTADNMRAGWTDLVIDDRPWVQGYLGVLQLCMSQHYNLPGMHIEIEPRMVDPSNVNKTVTLEEYLPWFMPSE